LKNEARAEILDPVQRYGEGRPGFFEEILSLEIEDGLLEKPSKIV